ncbi:MAG: DUF1579 domain-containing protein [Fimbriimonadaceae bacterium]
MSADAEMPVDPIEEMGPTKPLPEHAWLQRLIGEWTSRSEIVMPDGSKAESHGTETFRALGDLWVYGEASVSMPDGSTMDTISGYGYDVSFKHYVGFWISNFSSHLWKYSGSLSEDGTTLTLDCVGPDMVNEGQTANYRGTMTFLDDDHRTLTASGQMPDGQWAVFMTDHYTRR